MIYQVFELSINSIVGLGLLFSLALFMTVITTKTINAFFIFLTMFSGFLVWSGLLPLWILILNLIILTILMIFTFQRGNV